MRVFQTAETNGLTRYPSNNQTIPNSYINTELFLLNDDLGELDLIDTRKYVSHKETPENNIFLDEIPTKISGTYTEDYNIIYIDEIIKKKLQREKFAYLQDLRNKYKILSDASLQPQTYVMRNKTLDSMKKVHLEILQIETGEKLKIYEDKVKEIITEYKKYKGNVKTVFFGIEEEKYEEMNDDLKNRIFLIDSYLDIASDYIQIDIVRINDRPTDICIGCGISLAKVATNEEGTIRCPNPECLAEHNVIILAKSAKDGSRINTNNTADDESIDNFLRAFIRYQGLQPDYPDQTLYNELDEYFCRHDRPIGEEIRKLPLNNKGRRGDTDHKMLWNALSQIGRSEYYEDANLIGHIYWGWTLHNIMHLKERIIDKYNKTQKVFYQISPEERGRNSSLGTQYRLWRHLQLEGHDCEKDEFKIAENSESLRTHNKLWRLMCEYANDPEIYYIP